MPLNIFIDGGAGTTGLEIADRLDGRDEFSLIRLDDVQRKDSTARRDALNAADVAILCLPDDAAQQAVGMIDTNGPTRVIDASSAHRTTPGWVYGFPEIVGRDRVANAKRVSNPGCYPTGFLALMAPLTKPRHGTALLPADWPYSVNAVSGFSGGGKALIGRFEQDSGLSFRAYGLSLDHKHLAEMQAYAGLRHPPVFSPAVIAAMRGMIVDVPLPLSALNRQGSTTALWEALAAWFAGSSLVDVRPIEAAPHELLLRADAPGWDGVELLVCADKAGTQARLLARYDNLGKGASGAAVQSLNLMAGLPEETGLRLSA